MSNTPNEERGGKGPMYVTTYARGLRLSPDLHEEHYTLVAKVKKFSNLNIHTPGSTSQEFIDYEISHIHLNVDYTITVYPNGRDSSTKGYVSVAFVCQKFPSPVHARLFIMISIVDKEGNNRIPQSLEIFHDFSETDPGPSVFFHDHISRAFLLNDPSKWLTQDDILTIHMDLYFKHSTWDTEFFQSVNTDFETDVGPDGLQTLYLSLDTYLAQRLANESAYFKRLLVTPMVEMRSGRVRIPTAEYPKFVIIGRIFCDWAPIIFETVDEIFGVYEIAEKYDIGLVLETCRIWLTLCLSHENALEISEFAETYGDISLNESVQAFLKGESGVKVANDSVGCPATTENKLWIFTKRDSEHGYRFKCRLIHDEYVENNPRDDFDFYC